jgi:hypothetical protein
MSFERVLRWTLVSIAVVGLAAGGVAYAQHRTDIAGLSFTLATVPVITGLAISMIRDLLTMQRPSNHLARMLINQNAH